MYSSQLHADKVAAMIVLDTRINLPTLVLIASLQCSGIFFLFSKFFSCFFIFFISFLEFVIRFVDHPKANVEFSKWFRLNFRIQKWCLHYTKRLLLLLFYYAYKLESFFLIVCNEKSKYNFLYFYLFHFLFIRIRLIIWSKIKVESANR